MPLTITFGSDSHSKTFPGIYETHSLPQSDQSGVFFFMGKYKIFPYFQSVRVLNGSGLALLSFYLLLFIPTNPFQESSDHWIELFDEAKEKRRDEILAIHSVIKSHRMNLNEASTWVIAETISRESKKHSLDPMLVLALINVESRFHQTAVSTDGARGLMQIRPLVANALAEEVELESWEGEKSLDDPITNIKLGVFYLGYLKKSFRDLKLTLAAYNSGPTEINRRLEEEEELPVEFAMKVLSTYQLYRKQSRRTY